MTAELRAAFRESRRVDGLPVCWVLDRDAWARLTTVQPADVEAGDDGSLKIVTREPDEKGPKIVTWRDGGELRYQLRA